MAETAYKVAIFTRGTGAYTYTYSGPGGLERGQIAAVLFRSRIELGVILGVDTEPPDIGLLPAWPVALEAAPGWGELLLQLCELAAAAPEELAGHLLPGSGSTALKLHLQLTQPARLEPLELPLFDSLAGALTPSKQKQLAKLETWRAAVRAAQAGGLKLQVEIAGVGAQARGHPRWRRWYSVDDVTLRLWGLAEPWPVALPGSYLAGLAEAGEFAAWDTTRLPAGPATQLAETVVSAISWEPLEWPEDWALCRRWPGISRIPLRRASASWAGLRAPAGLVADIARSLAQGENVLLIAPQAWMLDRLWPLLAPWSVRVMRYRPEGGASATGHILRQLAVQPGQFVAGGVAAWKLAAYGSFQRVVLLDPSHPQFTPERRPALDPRLALLLALAQHATPHGMPGQPPAHLDLLDLGLSAWDGRGYLQHASLRAAFEPPAEQPRPGGVADTNPLPLELRQPGRRRLVYFNRLGSSRGLRCMECQRSVACPQCGSPGIHYSASRRGYHCRQCDFRAHELRCPGCGMATLATQLPGLEAVTLRPGDQLVQAGQAERLVHAECETVLGTAQLLEPLTGFWPEEVVYVHADARAAQLDDWPQALDMAARLSALYANPDYQLTYVVSDKLHGQLGPELDAGQLSAQWQLELNLKRLAGLPPYGTIYKLQVSAASRKAAAAARELLGRALQTLPETRLLRLGRPYEEQGQYRLAGLLINPSLDQDALQRLRWEAYRGEARLAVTTLWGPWL